MRTHVSTLVTLYTVFHLPFRYVNRDTAFFKFSRSHREGTVFDAVECADRQIVSFLCVHHVYDVTDKLRTVTAVSGHFVGQALPFSGYVYFHQVSFFSTGIYGSVVHVYHSFPFLAVRLHNGSLHLFYSQFVGNNIGNLEKCTLHNRVGAISQSQFLADFRTVDDIEVDFVFRQVFFHVIGQVLSRFFCIPQRVQQEGTAFFQPFQYIILVNVGRHVASHKVGRRHQIGGTNRFVTETQVRSRESA